MINDININAYIYILLAIYDRGWGVPPICYKYQHSRRDTPPPCCMFSGHEMEGISSEIEETQDFPIESIVFGSQREWNRGGRGGGPPHIL